MAEVGLALGELEARPITDLTGVGEGLERSLQGVGVLSVLDLISYYPRRYLDRTREATVASLEVGQEGMVLVKVEKTSARRTRQGRTVVEVVVADGTGSLNLVFFNQPWRKNQLSTGREAVLVGKVDQYKGRLQMANPLVDLVGDRTGRIVAVYPQSENAGLHSWDVDRLVAEALRRIMSVRGFADPLPTHIRDRYNLMSRSESYRGIHRPSSMREVAEARRRLVFDELFRIQLELVVRKRALEEGSAGVEHDTSGAMVGTFIERLGFQPTDAQTQAIAEITEDMARTAPMNRLLQGDVGSGKTVVAVATLLTAVQGGYQAAFMVPTEVLADQHHIGVTELLTGVSVPDPRTLLGSRPLRVVLLTSRTATPERRKVVKELSEGAVDILIGTHSLIQAGVEFSSLGAVVIDEQHRFGVEQRAALREKNIDGTVPDVLVMTATPIPRTAAMTVYGDLSVSVLNELPPGRTPITTSWEPDESMVWEAVRRTVDAGFQAYVVCPLIEESESIEVHAAEDVFNDLLGGELKGLRLGLLHGKVGRAEKEETMRLFRSGMIDVLVATTVIEVGVDVVNATVMVILDAARFGIAQLHQLRGRVGRGNEPGHCFLIGAAPTPEAEERLRAVVRTTDGFELAEVDLDLRGEGTVMGERQKGRNDLRLASLRRDREWVEVAREEAFGLVGEGDGLIQYSDLAEEVRLFLGEIEADYLFRS